ncbi:MAG: hypothetical protein HYT03_02605 [Candidatus Harrisonbacteria bacterium]|nr:hypothetical protein [Candidatus Harrisonbacteria bacterium]
MKNALLVIGLLIAGCCRKPSETSKLPAITDAEMRLISEQGGGVIRFPDFYKSEGWSKYEAKPSGEYRQSFGRYQLLHPIFGCYLAKCSDQPCKELANKAKFRKLFNWQDVSVVVAAFEKQHPAFQFLLVTVHKKRPESCPHGLDCQHCFAFVYDILAYRKE